MATVRLKDGSALGGPSFKNRTVSIADFGHGPPALLGSFSQSSIASHPFLWFTVTTKVAFAQAIADPLADTASALRQSMHDGAFIHTKYYAVSKRKTWRNPGEIHFVYANDAVLTHDIDIVSVPLFYKGNRLLVQYQSQSGLIRDAERYDYDLDSDIEEEDEEEKEKEEEGAPSKTPPYHHDYSRGTEHLDFDASDTASSIALSSDDRDDLGSIKKFVAGLLPSPVLQTHRIVLVRNTAITTWASYVYYCYTGQVSFYPLKSKDPHSRRDKTTDTLRCSPKSMYRLAVKLENARLQALAFQAIKSSLSKSNILDEAFSWFTAQYQDIRNMELELLMEFRSAPEVSARLSQNVEAISRGEKPHACAMLHAFLARLTQLGTGGTQ
ncbi:uncharacterized protein EDB91DRAFT_1243871 [Suillus paluster]|uniref:uncharacterized protein n=1 Tax=Suillus paluster TaxID=48578 RepID=UPI001B85B47E|nr:uncharacterized protein EDB91DRAFT_1243871 [Suillus paluster]KAG1751620.1 hypothetical protein EDB91DRAFT_1243871 [Suillus paluster]